MCSSYIPIKIVNLSRRCSSHVILYQQLLFYFNTSLTFSNSVMCFYNGSHCLLSQAPQLSRDCLHGKITLGASRGRLSVCSHTGWKPVKIPFVQIHIFFSFFYFYFFNLRAQSNTASALSFSAKLLPNYCLLSSAVKHNQSESLKDTISFFMNCLLVNLKSPSCFKSTNHRAVVNSNWFSMQCCKTKSHRILFLMATVFQLHNKR